MNNDYNSVTRSFSKFKHHSKDKQHWLLSEFGD